MRRWALCGMVFLMLAAFAIASESEPTRIEIKGDKWYINGQITYPGAKAEGLLMNVRMVNSIFEDAKRTDFDAEANADEFIAAIPDYAAHGVRAFTICLQGGMPGYEGAVNSAFSPDGGLREEYMKRARRVIEACDRHGAAVIVGGFYQRQDQILKDADAVRAAIVNVAKWIDECGFKNAMLETANEYDHDGFDHDLIKTTEGQMEIIALAKKTNPDLLVSVSGLGHGRMPAELAKASDFILIHFNGTSLKQIPERIQAQKKFGKPVVCNEDQKLGEDAAKAAQLSVENGGSWGFMHEKLNQHQPFVFKGAADDPAVYAKLKELTTPSK